jgi:zinc transporter ZupT
MNTDVVFWTKIAFIVVCWCEAFFCGCFPTWSTGCRENPKILGIANAFASGVFLSIAIIHLLPEEVDVYYNELHSGQDVFPLPYFLIWTGYTLILVIDKVMFDTSALFKDENDPARMKLDADLKSAQAADGPDQTPEIKVRKALEGYNSPYDKFATRMKNE